MERIFYIFESYKYRRKIWKIVLTGYEDSSSIHTTSAHRCFIFAVKQRNKYVKNYKFLKIQVLVFTTRKYIVRKLHIVYCKYLHFMDLWCVKMSMDVFGYIVSF